MKVVLASGETIDTATDLGSAERHVLQKVLAWRDLAKGLEQYRQKVAAALAAGWNDRGPVRPSPPMARLLAHFEAQARARLASRGPSGGSGFHP